MAKIKISALLISLLILCSAAVTDTSFQFMLLYVSTGTVKIDGVPRKAYDKCNFPGQIEWAGPNQVIKAKNLKDGKIYILRQNSMPQKKWSFEDYYIKRNPTSVRGMKHQVAASALDGNIIIEDTICITSPYSLSDSCFYLVHYPDTMGISVSARVPYHESALVLSRDLFGGHDISKSPEIRPTFSIVKGADTIPLKTHTIIEFIQLPDTDPLR